MYNRLKYFYLFLFIFFSAFSMTYSKKEKKIKTKLNSEKKSTIQLEKLIQSNSKLLYEIQKKLLKHHENINLLRGKIQEIEHKIQKNNKKNNIKKN